MTKDYKQLSDDDMLNYEDANTAQMDRYRRIMQHRSNEATFQLAKQLNGVTETIYRAGQGAQEKVSQLVTKIDEAMAKADEAIKNAEAAGAEQRKQQRSMKALTVTIATVAYTIINAFGTRQAYRGNEIQAQIAALATEQVAAMKEANDLQRRAVSVSTGVGQPAQRAVGNAQK